ncbi:MAG: hypothetical protein CFE21_10615 [Bacteroidetes bacterium B1(2017)]|nr:MAG: hypothetical protein CFE21_10615 [Bacteroidetes bacterium B1(2017)]
MNKRFQHIVLLMLIMAGLLIMGASCFQHINTKPVHTQLKSSDKSSFELLAELEEDETELEDHLSFNYFPFLHFLYSNQIHILEKNSHSLAVKVEPIPNHRNKITMICVFRI